MSTTSYDRLLFFLSEMSVRAGSFIPGQTGTGSVILTFYCNTIKA